MAWNKEVLQLSIAAWRWAQTCDEQLKLLTFNFCSFKNNTIKQGQKLIFKTFYQTNLLLQSLVTADSFHKY